MSLKVTFRVVKVIFRVVKVIFRVVKVIFSELKVIYSCKTSNMSVAMVKVTVSDRKVTDEKSARFYTSIS